MKITGLRNKSNKRSIIICKKGYTAPRHKLDFSGIAVPRFPKGVGAEQNDQFMPGYGIVPQNTVVENSLQTGVLNAI